MSCTSIASNYAHRRVTQHMLPVFLPHKMRKNSRSCLKCLYQSPSLNVLGDTSTAVNTTTRMLHVVCSWHLGEQQQVQNLLGTALRLVLLPVSAMLSEAWVQLAA